MPDQATLIRTIEQRDAVLEHRLKEIAAQRFARIAIFGAGKHTAHLLSRFAHLLPPIAFILDDNPSGPTLQGIPVRSPHSTTPEQLDAILISSDSAERTLAARANDWLAAHSAALPIISPYADCTLDFDRPHTEPKPRKALTAFTGAHTLVPQYNDRYDRAMRAAQVAADNEWRRARFYNLTNLLSATAHLPAATAEAGCYRGLSSHLICQTCRATNPAFDGSTHTIIDSFEGLSTPIEKDGDIAAARHAEKAFADTSPEHVRAALADFPNVNIYKGWIPQVLDQIHEAQYRFVHIDVDLYEPVLACLEYFYPRTVPGGIILVDDFGPSPIGSFVGCAQACNDFAARIGAAFAPLAAGNAFIARHAR